MATRWPTAPRDPLPPPRAHLIRALYDEAGYLLRALERAGAYLRTGAWSWQEVRVDIEAATPVAPPA